MTNDERPAPPAGWYPHPTMADTQRYWDGASWTDHVAPSSGAATPTVADARIRDDERTERLTWASVVMMVIFPIGGFIGGAMLLGRRAAAGALIMMFSVASMFIWYSVLTANNDLENSINCNQRNIDRLERGLPMVDCE